MHFSCITPWLQFTTPEGDLVILINSIATSTILPKDARYSIVTQLLLLHLVIVCRLQGCRSFWARQSTFLRVLLILGDMLLLAWQGLWALFLIRAKRVSNWYTPQKKSARLPACTCQIILVLEFTYESTTYVRTSARYQPATKIRVCIYVCARVGYVLCATYVRKLV